MKSTISCVFYSEKHDFLTENAVFFRIDNNGNGGLSLAEIDKAIIDGSIPAALGGDTTVYDHKPAILRAYKAADTSGDGFIERREFGKLLAYIVYFNNLWDTFDPMDEGVMNFAFKMMNFAFTVMNFAFKMMNFV